jgi:polysaccharide chain length determinant protein (PEP-CTERM system associated)
MPADWDSVRAIWHRRKWLAIVVCLWVLGGGVAATLKLPDLYRATATVLIERSQISEALITPLVTSELETRINTFSQQVLSRDRLEALIDRFDLYRALRATAPQEAVLDRMRRDIKFEFTESQASLAVARGWTSPNVAVGFRLSYVGTEPRTSAEVTNALASFYVEENSKLREEQASGTTEFLKTQVDELKERVAQQGARLSAYKGLHTGELPEMQDANLKTLERLNAQLQLNTESQRRAMERRDTLIRQLAEETVAPSTEARNPAVARLAELQRKLGEALSRLSERHPDVIRLRAEIATVEAQLVAAAPRETAKEAASAASGQDTVLDRFRQSIGKVDREAIGLADADLAALKEEEQRLREALAAYEMRVESSPMREGEFRELAREYEATTELYTSLLNRYEDARLAEVLEERRTGDSIRILDPALPPSLPVAPGRMSLLILSLVMGIVLAVGTMVIAERLDTSFHSVDDLRAFTRVPISASLPLIVTATDVRRARWRFCAALLGTACALALIVVATSYVADGNDQLVRLLARGRL